MDVTFLSGREVRGWKFRLYHNRKKSEDLFLNRVEEKYGKDCVLHNGDCSRKDQMKVVIRLLEWE